MFYFFISSILHTTTRFTMSLQSKSSNNNRHDDWSYNYVLCDFVCKSITFLSNKQINRNIFRVFPLYFKIIRYLCSIIT